VNTIAVIDQIAPQPAIDCWVQGHEPALEELGGQVVLIEVIQVNCPGCFAHALPEAIRLHESYASQGLKVFALATAFEHFEHNTLNKLQRLLETGEVQGDPLQQLSTAGFLEGSKLPYSIPFSVAMDKLVANESKADKTTIEQFILSKLPDFHQGSLSESQKESVYQQAEAYLSNKKFDALTFEMYQLQGTPSSILIDKQGILRNVSFGTVNALEDKIKQLLKAQ